MKYTAKFSLEIKAKDFYEMAIPNNISKKELQKELRNELYLCWNGIVDGEWGGSGINWEAAVYRSLWENGFIKQTQKCIDTFGVFK